MFIRHGFNRLITNNFKILIDELCSNLFKKIDSDIKIIEHKIVKRIFMENGKRILAEIVKWLERRGHSFVLGGKRLRPWATNKWRVAANLKPSLLLFLYIYLYRLAVVWPSPKLITITVNNHYNRKRNTRTHMRWFVYT